MIVKTRAVAGSAKRVKGSETDNLTHAVAYDDPPPHASGHSPHVFCGRVKEEHLLDDPFAVEDEDAPPTCPVCLKKDPREKAHHAVRRSLDKALAAIDDAVSRARHLEHASRAVGGELPDLLDEPDAGLAVQRAALASEHDAARLTFFAQVDAYLVAQGVRGAIDFELANEQNRRVGQKKG